MDIKEMTQQLAKAIKESKEITEYQKSKEELENHEAAKIMLKDLKAFQSLMEKNPADPDYPIYGIYSGNQDNTLELLERLGLQDAVRGRIYGIGPVIGAHIGPGAYGVVYVEKAE